MADLQKIKDLVVQLEIDDIAGAVKGALDDKVPAEDILQALSDGMTEVGKLYEKKEYYLPELVLAGETMTTGIELLKPHLKADRASKGTIVISTVKGDLHDIGKNVAATLLQSAGFKIVDLGKDVEPKAIVDAVKANSADIVALSSLLTMTVVEIENVAKALKEAGLRDKVKIICGGAPLNQELAEKLGADFNCDDAPQGVDVAMKIMSMKG
ncbi:MAG: cobalamin-dependent protein [Candidatus Lokiarchaeota archaeon]|nr:cobalamin-dependent protein [Candidatus Lokiarchaeota archaeon]